MTRPLVLLALAAAASAANAEPSRRMSTVYEIQPGAAPEGERELASKDWVLKQALLPKGLAELTEPAELKPGEPILPVGLRLIAVDSEVAVVRCVAARQPQKLVGHAQPCFVDADRDGRFEAHFFTTSDVAALLTISGRVPKSPRPLARPVAYRDIDPVFNDPPLFVGIQRRNYFNIYGRENFMIVFGSEGDTGEITAPVWIKAKELPKELQVMGARFTALGEAAGRLRVRVDAAMPRQPFGISTTTTYMFIPGS